jgi:short-subunit dehydrogenase
MKPIALVTGASRGLGRATATLLAQHGYEVWGTTRTPAPPDVEGIRMLTLELTSQQSVDACVGAVLERAGRVDLLVNNAGFPMTGAIEEVSLDEIEHEFQVNLFGMLRMTKAVLPSMRAQGSGRVINISSAAAFIPIPYYGVYGASKAALERLSFSLRQEVRPFGLHVSVISPSSHRTDVEWARPSSPVSAYETPRERMASAMRQTVVDGDDPSNVARAVLKAATARAPRARYLVGGDSKAFAIIQRLLPHALIERMIGAKFKLGSGRAPAPPALGLPPG